MADLTVTISESLTLNGKAQGGRASKAISGINDVFKRIVTITNAETSLYTTTTATKSGSVFDWDLVKYVRISNLDSANGVDLIIKQNSGNAEAGFRLLAGKSLILWDHSLDFEADAAAVTVNAGAVGTADMAVTDGDAVHGMTNGQYIIIISTDGTSKNYVLCDTAAGGAISGTALVSGTDIGSGTLNAVTGLTAGVAVGVNLSLHKQNAVLNELAVAVGSTAGHSGKITAGTVPAEANGAQAFTLTQVIPGVDGNTTTTENLPNFTAADFTSGVDGAVASKNSIDSVSAIANTSDVKLEVFIASA